MYIMVKKYVLNYRDDGKESLLRRPPNGSYTIYDRNNSSHDNYENEHQVRVKSKKIHSSLDEVGLKANRYRIHILVPKNFEIFLFVYTSVLENGGYSCE